MKKTCLLISCALLFSGCLLGIDDWDHEASYTTYTSSESSQGEETLRAKIELNVGQLLVTSGEPGTTYDLNLYYDENAFEPRLNFERSSAQARLDFNLSGKSRVNGRIGKTRLDVKLNPEARIDLDAQTGVAESEIDLTGLRITDIHLEAGVGETRVVSAAPNPEVCRRIRVESGVGTLKMSGLGNLNFERMDFHGGVGAAEIEFSGDWQRDAEVDLDVGIGGVDIGLPRGLGVEIQMSKSWLSGIDIRGFEKHGNHYSSENLDQATRRIRININAGIGGVKVRWR